METLDILRTRITVNNYNVVVYIVKLELISTLKLLKCNMVSNDVIDINVVLNRLFLRCIVFFFLRKSTILCGVKPVTSCYTLK